MRWCVIAVLASLLAGCEHTPADRETAGPRAGAAGGSRNAPEVRSIDPTSSPEVPHLADDGIERWPATVEGNGIRVRVARTRPQHFAGLGGVKLAENEGMFFMYKSKMLKSFWMKGCIIGLDIAWLSDDLKVLQIDSLDAPGPNTPDDEIQSAVAPEPIQYVLEMRKGWFAARGLGVGARVSVPVELLRKKAE